MAGVSQVLQVVKNLPASVGGIRDVGLIPRLGRFPRGRHGNPLQYSCLENPLDRGAWRATVHGAAEESDTTKLLNNDHNKGQMIGFRGVPSSCFCDSEHRSQKPTLVKCFSTMDGVKVSAGKETMMGLTDTGQAWRVRTHTESTEAHKSLETFPTPVNT